MCDTWNGFACTAFTFEDHPAIVVFPHGESNGRLALKTEYWGAFPQTELLLLQKGFHLCYIQNDNRWGTAADLDRKARFVEFVAGEYGLSPRCVPVGMSCGGLFAILFAAAYPGLVSCLYLDAPVVNYMSCPCGFGVGHPLAENCDEILQALGLGSISRLLAYRDMPLDRLPALVEAKIPVVMVAGDSDTTVPYCENGLLLQEAYEAAGLPLAVFIKPGCDHHPHGLADPTPVVEFILQHP